MAPLNDAVADTLLDLRNAALLAAAVVVLLWLIWSALRGRWRG